MSLKQETVQALGPLVRNALSVQEMSLKVVGGPHEGLVFPVEREIINIGRAEYCDISLIDDLQISHVHCNCYLDEKGLRIRDLGSRNGIFIHGVPVLEAYFEPGATLRIGQSELQLQRTSQDKIIPISYVDKSGLLLGKATVMRELFAMLPRLGERKITTLLTGETGTGKTSIARAIHALSDAPGSPFVVVNCGALPAGLIEAQLFGYEKGAFTGADKRHPGFFEQAHGGTLFLDEIGELPLEFQPKLLDVVERKKLRRVGGTEEIEVDVHLISATNRTLPREVAERRFREDLYFRLSLVTLEVPPLRERKEDLPLLFEAILKELSPDRTIYLTGRASRALEQHVWPGNVRELRNTLERALLFVEGDTLDDADLHLSSEAPALRSKNASLHSKATELGSGPYVKETMPLFPLSDHEEGISLRDVLSHTERVLVSQALSECDLNAPEAARLLGVTESWMYSRIRRYGLKSRRKG